MYGKKTQYMYKKLDIIIANIFCQSLGSLLYQLKIPLYSHPSKEIPLHLHVLSVLVF